MKLVSALFLGFLLFLPTSAHAVKLRARFTPLTPDITSGSMFAAVPPADPMIAGVLMTLCDSTGMTCATEMVATGVIFPCPTDPLNSCADFTLAMSPGDSRGFKICVSGAGGAACSNLVSYTVPTVTPSPVSTPTLTAVSTVTPTGTVTPVPTATLTATPILTATPVPTITATPPAPPTLQDVGPIASASCGNDIILDNLPAGQSGSDVSFTGTWCNSTFGPPYGTPAVYSCGTIADTYQFAPAVTGTYDISVRYTSNTNRSRKVPFLVNDGVKMTVLTLNEQIGGGTWVPIGRYSLAQGAYVQVNATNGQACIDGALFSPVCP